MTPGRALSVNVICTLVLVAVCAGQQSVPVPPSPVSGTLELYRQLRTAELDPIQVYKIRDAAIDREDLHFYLNDGIIGFYKAIDGRITGAFFEGDGEVLIRPPNASERASLGLFTGQGVLSEQFDTAYLRFNDDTAKELQSYLRPVDDEAPEFLAKNSEPAKTLAEMDALRLLSSFTSHYPQDHFFHARVGGVHLGVFDIVYDSMADEQLMVGNLKTNERGTFYDLWMSFPGRTARANKDATRLIDPWRSSEAVKVRKFEITAQLLPPQGIDAQADLYLKANEGGQRVLYFELSRYLKVRKVTLAGAPLEFIQNESMEGSELAKRGNDQVVLLLPRALKDGEEFQLHFEYSGNVMAQAGPGLLYVGARGTWYPSRGISMSDFDLEFKWPSDWTLVATGKRVSLTSSGNELTGRWISEVKMPLAGFNLGQYAKKSVLTGKVTVESYAATSVEYALSNQQKQQVIVSRPAPNWGNRNLEEAVVAPPMMMDPSKTGQSVAERCAQAIETYTKWFGPYPYSSLAVTQFPGGDSQGWPGLIFLSSTAFLPPAEQTRLKLDDFGKILYGDLMPWHETAHMWWGDVVFWRSYRDQWLVEALSNYSALMLLEKEHPEQFKIAMERYRSDLLSKAPNGKQYLEAGPVDLGVRLSSSEFPNGYVAISYGRGTWLLHMLRMMFRDAAPTGSANPDEAFLSALRTLRERYAFKEASTADLEKIFEEFLPNSLRYEQRKSLDWFFTGWVNGTAIPTLKIEDLKFSTRAEQRYANFTLTQKDAPKDLVTSVPIYAVLSENRKIFAGRVFADGETSSIRLRVPAGTKKLELDPLETILRRQ